ncbi:tetratricopeptide repeat protein [Polynucleobacter sp. MWH-UH23A]|uniref:tetratricopeptide repeat protein n=1 Tax=Polynucleobacter sp. MWH-UH23A TaxID=1855613 RepID=UPI003364CA4E
MSLPDEDASVKSAINESRLIFQEAFALLQNHEFERADALFIQAIKYDPKNIDALNLLGIRAYQKCKYEQSLHFLENANLLKPHCATILGNLGLTYTAIKQYEKALEYFDLANRANPNIPEIHNNRGNALKGLKKNDAALAAYENAINLRPLYSDAINNKGVIYLEKGEIGKAIEIFNAAIAINPNLSQAFNNLGNAYTRLGKYSLGFQAFEAALKIDPNYLDCFLNFGGALRKSRELNASIKCYQRAAEIDPKNADIFYFLGEVFYENGDARSAKESYTQALTLNPNLIEAKFALAIAQIPKVYENLGELNDARINFERQIKHLEDLNFSQIKIESALKAISHHPFYLAYQDLKNGDLISLFGSLCTKFATQIQQELNFAPTKSKFNKKIKVGIISHHFCDHPVWHAITKAWLLHLNQNLIEIHIINTGGHEDQETIIAKARANQYKNLGNSIVDIIAFTQNANFDVVLFPEVGMDPTTKALACMRLAPIQICSWGHPETTGLSTIDYFLSGQAFETQEKFECYSEKVILLPDLGTSFLAKQCDSVDLNLNHIGINPNRPIILCAGSPAKYLPTYDLILIEIAKKLPSCQFIFFNFQKSLTAILHSRMGEAFLQAGLDIENFVRVIPFQKREEFYGLMQKADLMLDTIGFSGFNTAMHAISCNLPVIAKDSQFMRGRLAAATLKLMGLNSLVCSTDEEYAALAVELIQNKNLLQTYKDLINKKKTCLFENTSSIAALEQFLLKIHKEQHSLEYHKIEGRINP